mmetsp:Transcript_35750/g.76221  ORF Transcript_35750/g.76221 Transcript_35750/m.76221 type:complete len:403 (-) Transcript_35750:2086-3294(-)
MASQLNVCMVEGAVDNHLQGRVCSFEVILPLPRRRGFPRAVRDRGRDDVFRGLVDHPAEASEIRLAGEEEVAARVAIVTCRRHLVSEVELRGVRKEQTHRHLLLQLRHVPLVNGIVLVSAPVGGTESVAAVLHKVNIHQALGGDIIAVEASDEGSFIASILALIDVQNRKHEGRHFEGHTGIVMIGKRKLQVRGRICLNVDSPEITSLPIPSLIVRPIVAVLGSDGKVHHRAAHICDVRKHEPHAVVFDIGILFDVVASDRGRFEVELDGILTLLAGLVGVRPPLPRVVPVHLVGGVFLVPVLDAGLVSFFDPALLVLLLHSTVLQYARRGAPHPLIVKRASVVTSDTLVLQLAEGAQMVPQIVARFVRILQAVKSLRYGAVRIICLLCHHHRQIVVAAAKG